MIGIKNSFNNVILFLVFSVCFVLLKDIYSYLFFLYFLISLLILTIFINFFFRNYVNSLVLLLSFLLLISFINANLQIFLYFSILIISLLNLFYNKIYFFNEILFIKNEIQKIKFENKIISLFALLFISTQIFVNENEILVFDLLHPIYTLSIGNSFEIFSNNDLSLIEKKIYYNFLAEKIPTIFSNIFNINILESLYLYSKLVCVLFLLIGLNTLIKELDFVNIPLVIIFFFPIYFIDINFFNYDHYFSRTIGFTNSYILASALIVFGTIFLIHNQSFFLIITLLLLILIKAQFFLVLYGCIILAHLKYLKFYKIFIISLIVLPIFLIIYFFLLKNAASEAHWLIFPQLIFERIPGLFFHNKLNINLIKLFSLIYPVILITLSIHAYFFSKEKKLVILSSLSISSFIGYLTLTEVVGLSSRHFYNASSFATVVILFYYLTNKNFIKFHFQKYIFATFIFISIFMLTIYSYKNSILMYQFGLIKNLNGHHLININEINTYNWIKNYKFNGTILNFNHYKNEHKDFLKSAIISKQIFLESSPYKGIIMDSTVSKKISEQDYFYNRFVTKSRNSIKLYSDFKKNSFNIPHDYFEDKLSLEMQNNLKAKLIYYLGLKKEYSLINIRSKLKKEIEEELYKLNNMDINEILWLKKFISKYNIKIIILQNYDEPNYQLNSISETIYINDHFTILSIK